jgi:hypothetical protein
MPNNKQFEAIDVQDFIFGKDNPIYLSMVEISKEYFKHIEMTYSYLEEKKVVSIEVPNEDCVYYLERIKDDGSLFRLTKNFDGPSIMQMLDGIETVNWLFAKVPFISLVGYSNI